MKQCQALVKKDPEKYRPLVNAYFTGGAAAPYGAPTLTHVLERMNPSPGDSLGFGHSRSSSRSHRNIATKELTVHERGLGIAADHPFVKFVVDDPERLFATQDKTMLLRHARYYDLNPTSTASAAERWLVDSAKIVEGTPAKTIPELEAWFAKIKASQPEHLHKLNGGFLSDLVQYETLRTLDHVKAPATLAELRFIRELASFNPDAESGIAAALRDRVAQVTSAYSTIAKPAGNLPELLCEFKTLAAERVGSSYFPPVFTENPQLRVKYQEAIQQAVGEIKDPAQKAQALEALIFRDTLPSNHADLLEKIAPESDALFRAKKYSPFRYDGALADPEFKEWAAKNYATTIAETLGADNGSVEYANKFKATVDRIAAEAPGSNSVSVLNKLGTKECGNKLLLGEGTATHLKGTLEKVGVAQVVKYNFHAAVGESALHSLGRNYSTRESAVDFLIKPFSKDNAAKFIESAEKALSEEDRNKFLSQTLSHEAKIEQMELFHKNFWSMPFEGRVIAAKQIIFDAAGHTDAAQGIEENVRFVLDKVMPHNNGQSQAEVRRGRQVVESYLEATKNLEDKRIITSAMLVANAPNGATAGEKLSVGKGLNLVLSSIDPAGDKVKQAIESHPDTPAHIKGEFKNAKTMAKDPPRHEWLDWVKESNANCAEHERIKPGKVLGAGSYGFTVEGVRPDGSKVARTILYPHVREKAENEFGILADATEKLVAKDAKFAPVTDMIRQAQRMSGIETDMDIAAKQAQAATKLYDGMKITADGKAYTFSAAKYMGHGVDHKDFEIIEGLHFNDLAAAAKTAEETAHVKGLAKASITAELFNILGGRPFDHDRHGGQQKIVGTHIGQFDFGAMTVTEMSAREKQMIGHVMGGTIKQHYVKGMPIAEALRTEIKRVATTTAEKDFLACVERGVLALGNFQSHLKGDELGEVIGAVFANGKADPAIKKAMEERLGGISGRVFSELEKKGRASGIAIEALEHQFTPSADMSPLKPPPKETLLERIPLKNEHIIGGAGAAVGFAGFGMLWHANHRIAKKKEKGEEITSLDRAEQIGGGVLGAGGTVTAIDGFGFNGKGLKSITGFREKISEEGMEVLRNSEGKLKFGKVGAVAVGAIAVGGALLYALSKKKKDTPAGGEEKLWAERVASPRSSDSQQMSAGM